MSTKIAVKKLTASDLTFFEWHFKNRNAGNQKAINLNRNVFVDVLYPSLPSTIMDKGGKIPIDLYIYGPGLHGEYNLQRKIVKFGTYKNWRLNGEFVLNPDETPERFNVLIQDDIVILVFFGIDQPSSVKAFFISQKEATDKYLYQSLNTFLNDNNMLAISFPKLEQLLNEVTMLAEHPLNELLIDELLEDAALNGYKGNQLIRFRKSGKKLSRIELNRAKQNADAVGQLGEEFVYAYLENLKENAHLRGINWASIEDAVSPYDFEITDNKGNTSILDVKSTTGNFNRAIHISLSELIMMRESNNRYDLYRIYGISDSTAKLRISRDLSGFANAILEKFEKLQKGVMVDSISVDPRELNFDREIEIKIPDGDENAE